MQVGVMIDVSDPFYVPITPISGPFGPHYGQLQYGPAHILAVVGP